MDQFLAENNHLDHRNSKVSPRELVLKYLPFVPWVAASVILCLLVAFIKLRYSPNVYSVSGTILIKDQNQYASGSDKFGDIFTGQSSRNLNDEIQVIRSRNMAKRVVKSLAWKSNITIREKSGHH
jgi:uncharacterized protein involved in exopolysaccharide biosynthesis